MTEPTTTYGGTPWAAPRINGHRHAIGPVVTHPDGSPNHNASERSDGHGPDGHGVAGYDATGYDTTGYDATGYDATGYDATGYDATGYDPEGHGPFGHGSRGHGPGGYGPAGHGRPDLGANGVATNGVGTNGAVINGTAINGTPLNGVPSASGTAVNGTTPNGLAPNGMAPNGMAPNWATANGTTANGVAANGAGFEGTAADPYPVDRLAPRQHVGWDAPRTPARTAAPAVQIDYELVSALQAEVSRMLIDALRGEVSLTNDDRRRMTQEFTERVVRRNVDDRLRSGETGPITWPGYDRALCNAISAYLVGLGRLQPLIDDPDVENIMVLGTRVRVVYANGVIDEDSFTAAASDEELIALLQRLAERGGQTERSLSTAKPILHLRLPDGARLTVIYVVTARPVVVIRRHRVKDVSLSDMVSMGAITPTLKNFLEAAVRAHMNIMIAGRANAGKTTLLRAIADEIPRDEWFCVLETVGELGLDATGRHPWAVCFEEREGFGEKGPDGRPDGQLTIDDLFPHMLRLSANRIIVGEVRAEEIVAMFDAMNTTYGSLCTIHSRDEHGVFDRLAELLLRYGASKNREGAYLTIGNALDLVVYVNMEEHPGRKPRRYVSSVMEVHGLGEGRQLSRSRIFAPGPDGLAAPTSIRPSERRAAELQAAGFDMRLLLAPQIGSYHPGGGG
jgi:Flp pilus assembly CpaF family ATPase